MKGQAQALQGGAGFWVLATADPNTEAADGAFVDALFDVVTDDAWAPAGGVEFLTPLDLAQGINERLKEQPSAQQALVYLVAGGRIAPPFVRNPQFTTSFDGLSLDDHEYWDVKARGVDAASLPGWFFTGREAALRELVEWLNTDRGDGPVRIVTGGPGSGKSAVLAWLVLAAQPSTRAAATQALAGQHDLIPPEGAITGQLNLRGVRTNDAVRAVAKTLGLRSATMHELLVDLKSQEGQVTILVDSLDESAEPHRLVAELLIPLASLDGVCLLIGMRRLSEPLLYEAARVIDLDDPEYFDADDIRKFVFKRLVAELRSDQTRTADEAIQPIADMVARRAGFSFLYARVVARTLALRTKDLDTSTSDWQHRLKLPAGLPEAFEEDLERFEPARRRRIVDLLLPLAYSRGKGLPQKDV